MDQIQKEQALNQLAETNNGVFVKRNFLFVSYDGLISDTAHVIFKEGHDVKYAISNPEDKEVGDGFVPKVDDWKEQWNMDSEELMTFSNVKDDA